LAAAAATGAWGRAVAAGVLGIRNGTPPGFWIPVIRACPQAAGSLFRDGGPAGAPRPVKVILFLPGGYATSAGVLILETVDFPFAIPVPAKLAPTTTAQRLGLLVIKK
jgi:hypothetical protein